MPTVLAGIGILLASFVKRVAAFVRAIRMANACGRREARDGRRLVSAVLAVERHRLLRLRKGKRRQADNCQYRNGSSNHFDPSLQKCHHKVDGIATQHVLFQDFSCPYTELCSP